jgi:very-short-patch-repair endonuclease
MQSALEARLLLLLRCHGIPRPVTEHRFAPPRRWRFDLAWPDLLLAVEVEGGVWTGGRHTRGRGYIEDCRKYNAAALAGWAVLRYTSDTLAEAPAEIALAIERKRA